jgi:dTDP-4-amino-4,6-dideoxygalactose transaminase
MTDFQAAMGYSQILNYKKNLEHRKKIAGLYYKILSKNIKIMLPKLDPGSSYFIFQIFIKKKLGIKF